MQLSNQELDVAVKLVEKDRKLTKNRKRPTYSHKTKQLCVNLAQEPRYKAKLNGVLGSGTLDYWLKTIDPTVVIREEWTDTTSIVTPEERKAVHKLMLDKPVSTDSKASKFNRLRKELTDQISTLTRQIELLTQLEESGYEFPENLGK